MGINTTAPLYNVGIYTARANITGLPITASLRPLGFKDNNGTYSVAAQDLVILKDLTSTASASCAP